MKWPRNDVGITPYSPGATDASLQREVVLDRGPVTQRHDSAGHLSIRVDASSKTPQLAWLEVLETGVAELDAWHRQLIDDCNRLLELVANRAAWIEVIAAAALLGAQTMDHFRFEEQLMKRSGFPRRESHIAEHRRIAFQLRDLLAGIKAVDGSQDEDRLLPAAFKPLLIDLMVRHDLDYRSHLLHQSGR